MCQHTADGVLHEENRVRTNEVLEAELCISGFIVEELCVSSGKKRNKVHVLCLPRSALEKEKFTVLSFGTALKNKKKPEEMLGPEERDEFEQRGSVLVKTKLERAQKKLNESKWIDNETSDVLMVHLN